MKMNGDEFSWLANSHGMTSLHQGTSVNIDIGLLPPVSTPSKHHCNPDEDVDSVHVDSNGGVNRVKGGSSIVGGVVLRLVDHFLGVVEQEGAKL